MSELIPEILLHTQSRARLVVNSLAKLICHRAAALETETDSLSELAPAPSEIMGSKTSILEPTSASKIAVSETAPSYRLLDNFLEPAYLQAKREGITSTIVADPDLIRLETIREAKDRNAKDGYEAYRAGDKAAEKLSIDKLFTLDAEEAAINPKSKDQFGELEYQLYQIDRHNSLVVDESTEEAQVLIGLLRAQAAVGDADAPFANYEDPTNDTKSVFTTNLVTSYLRNKKFTNYICASEGGVIVESWQPGKFEVPLALITYVAGLMVGQARVVTVLKVGKQKKA